MERNLDPGKTYEEPFKHAAVQFLRQSGKSVEEVSAELGLAPDQLRNWKKKYPVASAKTVKRLDPVSQLQAENQALRQEILHLKVQWDVLKTTLGILTTSVCQKETHA